MASPSHASLPVQPRERWLLHLGLFLATFASVTLLHWVGDSFAASLQFAAALLAILLTHELGHYFMGLRYGVSISPPYFIPVPLGIGTLGAVIRIRTLFPTRKAALDIGAAGPLAGMAVALPLLVWGVAHAEYQAVAYAPGTHLPGTWSLYALGHGLAEAWRATRQPDVVLHLRDALSLFGLQLNPAHAAGWSGDNLLVLGLSRLFLGPRPPGADLTAGPVFVAAWWGMMITSLNLLPIGQLDGGHVTFALFGRKAELLGKLVSLGMVGLIVFGTVMWLPWLLLTRYLVGYRHPPLTYPAEPLPRSRYAVALLSLAVLVLVFLPVPLEVRPVP